MRREERKRCIKEENKMNGGRQLLSKSKVTKSLVSLPSLKKTSSAKLIQEK